MLIEFTGKRVLVVGAARGIGRAITEAFAERGGEVWAADILVNEVAAFAKAFDKGAGSIHSTAVDVADPNSVATLLEKVRGAVDVLVYVAGGVRGQTAKPVDEFHRRIGGSSSTPISPARSSSHEQLRRQ